MTEDERAELEAEIQERWERFAEEVARPPVSLAARVRRRSYVARFNREIGRLEKLLADSAVADRST